jgi:hypothetical protein
MKYIKDESIIAFRIQATIIMPHINT